MLLSSSSLIVGVVLIIVSMAQGQNLTSPCTSLNEVFSHPTDCTRYIQCIWGQPLDRPCAPGTFFSFSFRVCVYPWNKTADTCLKTQDSVVTTCKNYPTALFASPIKCNQYYNCSGHSTLIYFPPVSGPDSDDFYRFECPFPQLFSDVTMRCEDYQNVQCGQRFKPLNKCEYDRHRCQKTAFCTPCDVQYPSCRGLPDGPNVFKNREWSSFFAVCEGQRVVNMSVCPTDERLNVRQMFSPEFRRCVTLYDIPFEHGGHLLDCTYNPDGLYPDYATKRTNLFFRCISGVRTEISFCPGGQKFDAKISSCSAS